MVWPNQICKWILGLKEQIQELKQTNYQIRERLLAAERKLDVQRIRTDDLQDSIRSSAVLEHKLECAVSDIQSLREDVTCLIEYLQVKKVECPAKLKMVHLADPIHLTGPYPK